MGNIKLDKRNYRVHSQKNKDLIKKSLTELGAGRSVVIDSEDTLVAGNGVFEQAQKIGMPTKIIETDGSELIVVKRTDLKTDDEKRKKLALADNSISDTSEFDFDVMANDFMIEDLAEWGIELKETEKLSILIKDGYESMYYEPTEKPLLRLQDCIDFSKFDKKLEMIKNSPISNELKAIFRQFAYRFIKIDFESVANYYAFCATDEEKKVIEQLRLVLVDNGVNGFIEDDLLKIDNFLL